MHLGVPVITTNIGNLKEIKKNDKEGILIEPIIVQDRCCQRSKKIDEDKNFAIQ